MAPDLLNPSSSFHYMIVRQLLARLVFSLGIDSSLSMEIVAFWLWVQGNGHADFLARVDSFSNDHLREIAAAGNRFIEALFLKASDDFFFSGRSAEGRSYFQIEAVEGVVFYTKNVCYKVFQDLQEMAKIKEPAIYSSTASQGYHENTRKGKAPMNTKDLLAKIRAAYVAANNEEKEGTTSSSRMLSSRNHILEDVKCTIDQNPSTYGLANLIDTLSIRDMPDPAVQIQQHTSVPSDERTLFVTFSNGYPLTKDELYEFFMRNYGDVEEISVEEPIESRPPLYAHVTFFSQMTLFNVLDGNKRVKFVTRGKHLWARQFVPKKKKVEE